MLFRSPFYLNQQSEGQVRKSELSAQVGQQGVVETPLRPVGRVRIGEELFDAVAEEGLIESGVTIEVIQERFGELVVRVR